MPKMIQIRNVPDTVHRKLKVRAALAGMSLSEFLLAGIQRLAELPTRDEIRQRLAGRPPVTPTPSAADAIREERDRR